MIIPYMGVSGNDATAQKNVGVFMFFRLGTVGLTWRHFKGCKNLQTKGA